MLKSRSFIASFFIVFLIAGSFSTKAMEETEEVSDDWESPVGQSTLVPLDSQAPNAPRQPIGDATLDKAFSPITRSVPKPTLPRQILAGICSVASVLPAIQVGIPVGMMGLGTLGVSSEVLPTDSPESYAVAAFMGACALSAGSVAAYQSALWLTEPQDPDVQAARRTVTERDYSYPERLTYSYVTQACQTLLVGGLLFAFIFDMESHVSGWGDTRVWGYTMGLPAFFITYFLLTRATNTPNNHPFRPAMRTNPSEGETLCRNVVENTEKFIQENGLTSEAQNLGERVRVIAKPLSPPTQDATEDDNTAEGKLHYLAVFEQIGKIHQEASHKRNCWNQWTPKLSRWGSLGLQMASLPMMGITTYDLLHQFFMFCGVSGSTSMRVGAGLTAVPGLPALLLVANKGLSLVEREIKDLLGGYMPEEAGHFWGQRIPSALLAPAASLIFFTLPVSHYLSNQVLNCNSTQGFNATFSNCTEGHVQIDNAGGRTMLVIPFAAATLYPLGRQFFSRSWGKITNWIATGGEIDFSELLSCCSPFRFFPCLDRDHKRKQVLLVLERVRGMKSLVGELNPAYIETLFNDLRQPWVDIHKETTEDQSLLSQDSSL